MILWLMERVSVAGRIVVTILMALVIADLFLAVLLVGDSVRKDTQAQIRELREDHREIRNLMIQNKLEFGGIVERNTEAVRKAAKVVEDLPGK